MRDRDSAIATLSVVETQVQARCTARARTSDNLIRVIILYGLSLRNLRYSEASEAANTEAEEAAGQG